MEISLKIGNDHQPQHVDILFVVGRSHSDFHLKVLETIFIKSRYILLCITKEKVVNVIHYWKLILLIFKFSE